MRFLIPTLILILTTTTAASADPLSEMTERVKKNQRQAIEVTRDVAYDLGEKKFSCSIPADVGLTASLKRSNADAVTLSRLRHARSSGDGTKYLATKALAQIAVTNSRALLEVAGWLLEHKCLDEADELYRDLFESYRAEEFPEIRAKAQLGIDDVRTARLTAAR